MHRFSRVIIHESNNSASTGLQAPIAPSPPRNVAANLPYTRHRTAGLLPFAEACCSPGATVSPPFSLALSVLAICLSSSFLRLNSSTCAALGSSLLLQCSGGALRQWAVLPPPVRPSRVGPASTAAVVESSPDDEVVDTTPGVFHSHSRASLRPGQDAL